MANAELWSAQHPYPYSGSGAQCNDWAGIPKEPVEEMQCGILWLVNTPMSGSSFIAEDIRARVAATGVTNDTWKLIDIQGTDKGFESGSAWREVVEDIGNGQPKIIINYMATAPAPGLIFEDILRPLRSTLRGQGCRLMLATVLRDPVLLAQDNMEGIQLRPNTTGNSQSITLLDGEQGKDWRRKHRSSYYQVPHPLAMGASEMLLAGTLNLLEHFDFVGRTERISLFTQRLYESLGWPTSMLPHAIEVVPRPVASLAKLHSLNAVDMTVYQSYCNGVKPSGSVMTHQRSASTQPML